MSDQQFAARLPLTLAVLRMAGSAALCFTGWRRIAFFIAAAICAAPAVVALFVTAVMG